jgi:hypothetical protein
MAIVPSHFSDWPPDAQREYLVTTSIDHEQRLRTIEQVIWKVLAAATTGGVLGGTVMELILRHS